MPRDGRFLENLGFYNPEANPKDFRIKHDRVAHWINQGAQPSETVRNLLKQDRHAEKAEAIEKGLDPDTLQLERMGERKRKVKKNKKKSS
jgi:small subunit ribosomal protein S16